LASLGPFCRIQKNQFQGSFKKFTSVIIDLMATLAGQFCSKMNLERGY
jgi:hypothetical protein